MVALGKMVGFVLTKDYDKARAFYESALGCEFVSLDQFALVVKHDGHQIRISKVADFTPARSTVLGWEVSDIERVVDALAQRGVMFER